MRLLSVSLLFLAGCATEAPLPNYGEVPRFHLTSQSGGPLGRSDLEGFIWVADFIFTNCTGPCPRMSSLMRHIQASAPRVKLVSFTVDPDRDSPPVLAAYARRYQADPSRWYFLTGARAELNDLGLTGFKLGNVDGSLVHSTRFVLVDRKSKIRGYYGTDEDDPSGRLLRDVRRLDRETS